MLSTPKAERLEADRKAIGCSRYSRRELGAGLQDKALRKRRPALTSDVAASLVASAREVPLPAIGFLNYS
jgi:hypothetical protein